MEDSSTAVHKMFLGKPSDALINYFTDVSKLGYEESPNYNNLSSYFLKYLSSQKLNRKSTDHFDWIITKSPAKSRKLSERMYGSPFSVKNGLSNSKYCYFVNYKLIMIRIYNCYATILYSIQQVSPNGGQRTE